MVSCRPAHCFAGARSRPKGRRDDASWSPPNPAAAVATSAKPHLRARHCASGARRRPGCAKRPTGPSVHVVDAEFAKVRSASNDGASQDREYRHVEAEARLAEDHAARRHAHHPHHHPVQPVEPRSPAAHRRPALQASLPDSFCAITTPSNRPRPTRGSPASWPPRPSDSTRQG